MKMGEMPDSRNPRKNRWTYTAWKDLHPAAAMRQPPQTNTMPETTLSTGYLCASRLAGTAPIRNPI